MSKLLQKKLTPEQEAAAFDKARDQKAGNEPVTKDQKIIIKDREERNRLSVENAKIEYLKPFNEFKKDPWGKIEYLCSEGDFSGNYDKRMDLFNLMIQIQIQQSLKELIIVLKARK